MSWTWRRTTPGLGRLSQVGPHPPHARDVIDDLVRVARPEQRRPARARLLARVAAAAPPSRARWRGAGPSAEGGCEEFRELRPNRRSSSATRAVSSSIIRACASISASNSSRDGSDPDTTHDHTARTWNGLMMLDVRSVVDRYFGWYVFTDLRVRCCPDSCPACEMTRNVYGHVDLDTRRVALDRLDDERQPDSRCCRVDE